MSSSYEAELTRDAGAPSTARRLIERWFAERVEREELDKAVLLTSELVTNAVRHGEGTITLRTRADEDSLLVEVIDEGRGLEHTIRERDFSNVEGWGLRIVDSVASRWGAHEGTTHVWFELERRGPRLGAEKSPLGEGDLDESQ